MLEENSGTNERIRHVADLVDGFETPFGLELLSTVHWVATHISRNNLENVIAGTYAWNKRKKQFTERQIRIALEVLGKKGWLERSVA